MVATQSNRCGERHKRRLLTVKQILEEESDRDHRFSVKQLLGRLEMDATEANMRAIRSDIKALREFGVAVACEKHRTFEYYVSTRAFKQDELKMLVDIVQSSRSIDEQTSQNLVESILGLGSLEEAKSLKAGIRLGNRAKTKNDQVFHNIEIIQGAITKRHKVQFAYFDIGFDLERDYRYEGRLCTETPILLTYLNDCYYMISYNEDKDRINARRLDRMDRTLDTQKKASRNEKIQSFDLEDFEYTQFNMFLGPEAEWVTLQVNDKKMMNPLYDHFGDRLKGHITPPKDGEPAQAQVKVVPSAQFDGWVYGMNGGLEVASGASPEKRRRSFKSPSNFS